MKIFISMFMVLALVMATSLPSMSHAMMTHDAAKVEKTEASGHGDCHKHAKAEQSEKTAQNDKDHGKCCDEGICKCIGGTCYNGLSKVFGNSVDSLLVFISGQSRFGSTNESGDSAFLEGLKRPPKA